MSGQFGAAHNTEMMGAVSSKTRGWQYPVQSVTTKSVTQINCECEIQLFDPTNVILNRQPTRLSESLSNNDSWPDSWQDWLDGRYFLDCPNLHLRTLLIRGFLHSLDPELAAGCLWYLRSKCGEREMLILDDAAPSCHLLTSSVSCQGENRRFVLWTNQIFSVLQHSCRILKAAELNSFRV